MSRAFSSTTCWLASALSSSQASQKSMFSSLYSVRRNSRNTLRPAGLCISLSKDCAQLRTSSGVGVGVGVALRGASGHHSGCVRLHPLPRRAPGADSPDFATGEGLQPALPGGSPGPPPFFVPAGRGEGGTALQAHVCMQDTPHTGVRTGRRPRGSQHTGEPVAGGSASFPAFGPALGRLLAFRASQAPGVCLSPSLA